MEHLRREGAIHHWAREVSTGVGRRKVDLVVDDVAIELKTALCAKQKGDMWRLPDYVDWIVDDVVKLSALRPRWHATNHFFVMVLAYPSPPAEDWGALLEKISGKAVPGVVDLSRRDDIGSGSLSIGWLSVG